MASPRPLPPVLRALEFIHPIKPLKDVQKFVLRDSDACVANAQNGNAM